MPISPRAQGVIDGTLAIRPLHCRTGNVSWSAATDRSATFLELNGPTYSAPSSSTCRTRDSRGHGSTVSLTQCTRSGNRERRL